MPDRLVIQANGRYAFFSTIVDDITVFNMTREEVIDLCVREAAEAARERAELWLAAPRPGRDHFTIERLRSEIVMNHGEALYNERVQQLSAEPDAETGPTEAGS